MIQRRAEAFFGRRKTKALSARKQNLFETVLPKLLIDLRQPLEGSLQAFLQCGENPVCLEIGFGGGEHLVHEALGTPQKTFIGVEPFINSMGKALAAIDENTITNIHLYNDDACELLDWLPDECMSRIDLLYPDPWHKKRHWKRRFVNTKNLDRFARVLKPGGIFRFASDIETYVNWTLAHCDRHPAFEWTANVADDWRKPWPGWPSTRYEAKALREGRTPCYLVFERK